MENLAIQNPVSTLSQVENKDPEHSLQWIEWSIEDNRLKYQSIFNGMKLLKGLGSLNQYVPVQLVEEGPEVEILQGRMGLVGPSRERGEEGVRQ